MTQEIKFSPRLSEWQTQALFIPQTMGWIHSLIPVDSHLVPVLIDAGMFLLLELICVQSLLYTWISLEAFSFFCSKNLSERYFKLLSLA